MTARIYITNNDTDNSEWLSGILEREGYSVTSFSSGESFLKACEESLPDLVILDSVQPGMDSLSICSELHLLYPALRIIILSERAGSYDRAAAFSLGCSDYVIKPFLPLELSFRVRILLNTRVSAFSAVENMSALHFGPLTLDPGSRMAMLGNDPFSLTPTEFDFLAYLIRKDGSAASREELLKNIWEVSWDANTRVADDLVKRLRRKFRSAGSPIRIETVWGYGFRISLGAGNGAAAPETAELPLKPSLAAH